MVTNDVNDTLTSGKSRLTTIKSFTVVVRLPYASKTLPGVSFGRLSEVSVVTS